MSKTVLPFILGFVACGLIVMIMLGSYTKTVQAKEMTAIEEQTLKMMKDSAQKFTPPTINDIKIKILNLDEKIGSTNKRFDDLYILGGIIITLLIAINIGIFISVDNKVDKYFKEHFDEHEKSIVNSEKVAGELLGKIRLYHSSLPTTQQNAQQQTPQP